MKSNIAHPGSKRGFKYPLLANVNRYDNGVSPYGIYQMAGNVSEWVGDWFDPEYYQRNLSDNPRGRLPANSKYSAAAPGTKIRRSRDPLGEMPAHRIIRVI